MPEAALPRGYILSFDYGLKRIGVAVGQATTGTATPLETVRHGREPDWDSIARLIRDGRPALALVGLPLGAEGDETPMSRAARAFGADMVSIGNIERWEGAPLQMDPRQIMPEAKSVIDLV